MRKQKPWWSLPQHCDLASRTCDGIQWWTLIHILQHCFRTKQNNTWGSFQFTCARNEVIQNLSKFQNLFSSSITDSEGWYIHEYPPLVLQYGESACDNITWDVTGQVLPQSLNILPLNKANKHPWERQFFRFRHRIVPQMPEKDFSAQNLQSGRVLSFFIETSNTL